MSYLSKEAYEGKAEFAARRMMENAENKSLTLEQHEALAELCKIRHEIHSAGVDHIWADQNELTDLMRVQDRLNELDLPCPTFYDEGEINGSYIVCYDDYCDHTISDEWQEAHDACIDDVDNDEDYPGSELDWCIVDYMKSKLADQLEDLNRQIEKYLKSIDEKYGTDYEPSGASRIF